MCASKQYVTDPQDAVWRDIGGEVILMRLRDGEVFSLADTGAFLWQALEKAPCSEEELLRQLREEFEVEEEVARTDLREFLAEMQEAGLLRVEETASEPAAPGAGG